MKQITIFLRAPSCKFIRTSCEAVLEAILQSALVRPKKKTNGVEMREVCQASENLLNVFLVLFHSTCIPYSRRVDDVHSDIQKLLSEDHRILGYRVANDIIPFVVLVVLTEANFLLSYISGSTSQICIGMRKRSLVGTAAAWSMDPYWRKMEMALMNVDLPTPVSPTSKMLIADFATMHQEHDATIRLRRLYEPRQAIAGLCKNNGLVMY